MIDASGLNPCRRNFFDAAFLDEWKPKDFLLKPILEEGRLYTLTGPTGTGKTAIVLLIALHIAMGWPLGTLQGPQVHVPLPRR